MESFYVFNLILQSTDTIDFEKQIFKTINVVLYGEYIKQNFTIGIYDETIMLVLGYVDSYINHNDTSEEFI
jgi:hypothetical protein